MIGFSFLKEIKHFLRSEKWHTELFGVRRSRLRGSREVWLSNARCSGNEAAMNDTTPIQFLSRPRFEKYYFSGCILKNSWVFECRPHTGVSKRRDAAGLQTSTISMTQQTSEVSSFRWSGTIKTQRSACEMDYSHIKPLILWTSDLPLWIDRWRTMKHIWLGWQTINSSPWAGTRFDDLSYQFISDQLRHRRRSREGEITEKQREETNKLTLWICVCVWHKDTNTKSFYCSARCQEISHRKEKAVGKN